MLEPCLFFSLISGRGRQKYFLVELKRGSFSPDILGDQERLAKGEEPQSEEDAP